MFSHSKDTDNDSLYNRHNSKQTLTTATKIYHFTVLSKDVHKAGSKLTNKNKKLFNTTVLQLSDFVWDNHGEALPEETSTHSHLSVN